MSNFSIGDVVKIREWDDMVDEFGLNENGNINTQFDVFAKAMRYLCGEIFTIQDILNPQVFFFFFFFKESFEPSPINGKSRWTITKDMIEHIDNDFLTNKEELIDILTRE